MLDFNGRRVSTGMARFDSSTSAFMVLSSDAQLAAAKGGLPDVMLRNGEIFSLAEGRLFVVEHGSLAFENMKAELDCTDHASGYATIVRVHGSEDPDFIRGASVSVDKDTELIMTSAGLG